MFYPPQLEIGDCKVEDLTKDLQSTSATLTLTRDHLKSSEYKLGNANNEIRFVYYQARNLN